MSDRDELDILIDSELSTYAEPRPGLEQRILVRLEARASSPSRFFSGWRLWAFSGGLAMGIVLLLAVPRLTHRDAPVSTARAVNPDLRPPVSSESTISEVHPQVRRLPRTVNASPVAARLEKSRENTEYPQQPKLNVFPAPRPLSPQEQALVALATAPSDSGRERLVDHQRQLDAPLQISAIQIAPITMPDEGKN